MFASLLLQAYFKESFYHSLPHLFDKLNSPTKWSDVWLSIAIQSYEQYFICRESASTYQCSNTHYLLAQEAIKDSLSNIQGAKEAFIKSKNADTLLATITEQARHLLITVSCFLGHCAGLQTGECPEKDSFKEYIDKYGLRLWCDKFGKDYEEIFSKVDTCPSEENFLKLAQHIERIFWQMKIFVWEEQEMVKCYVLP